MSEIDETFLIDDDDVDVMAIRRALLRISNPPKLIVAIFAMQQNRLHALIRYPDLSHIPSTMKSE